MANANTIRSGVKMDAFESIDEGELASVAGGAGLAELAPLVNAVANVGGFATNLVRSVATNFFGNLRQRLGR